MPTYRLPDGSDDTPDEHGNHTATVNVYHCAAVAARYPGCEICALIVRSDAHSAVHATVFSGWDGQKFTRSAVECQHPEGTPCYPEPAPVPPAHKHTLGPLGCNCPATAGLRPDPVVTPSRRHLDS